MDPAFCYHLGDVVYYNGEVPEYWPQFYEPYEHYPLPIVAIPGNHDGELLTRSSISLEGFHENFLALLWHFKKASEFPSFEHADEEGRCTAARYCRGS